MTETKDCFVLMPFASQYREVYDLVYRPVCEQKGLTCWRVDEVNRPGSITRDIVDGIIGARILIADLTGRNANVFYELGIAHSIGNKTIMTAQRMDDVPFDIANYRVILYEQTIAGSNIFKEKLSAAIDELLAALQRTNNPVQEVLNSRHASSKQLRTPLAKLIDLSGLHKAARDFLRSHKIVYADQLQDVDLQTMGTTPGLGKASLEQLVYVMLEYDLYGDVEKLQDFILENSLSVQHKGYWRI